MCYVIITGSSIIWFLLTIIADMLITSAMVSPKWLIGPTLDIEYSSKTNVTTYRYPSVGIYTRCKIMENTGSYHCGPFDLDGFSTDSNVYPTEWKAAMLFILIGFIILTITVFLTLITCCRQSFFGKSIHNLTGCIQVIAGICVMISLFLHPLGWGAQRVTLLCGTDAEAFYPAMCTIGWSFYCAVIAVILCVFCAGFSLKAESSNMRTKVRKRIEEGIPESFFFATLM